MTEQLMTTGPTGARKYARISSPVHNGVGPPGGSFMALVGEPSTGKTSFMASNPRAFILNCDRSQLPVMPEFRAAVWPVRNPAGELIGSDGQPVEMTWNSVHDTIDILCEMAENDEERPETVIFDTIAGQMQLAMQKHMNDRGVTDWRQLDGRAGWDWVYNSMIGQWDRLRTAGYGVCLVLHAVNKIVSLEGGDGQTRAMDLTITGNFWSRFFWKLDLVIALKILRMNVKETRTQDLGNGQTREFTKDVPKDVQIASVSNPEFRGIVKSRVTMTDVTLSRDSAWQDFETAFNQAANARG